MPAPKWTTEAARTALEVGGFDVVAEERTRDGYGTVLRCAEGALVLVYDSGKVLCQGKRMADTKPLFAGEPTVTWTPPPSVPTLAPTSSASRRTAPEPIMPSARGVRFVRNIPNPDGADDVDLPW